MQRKVIQMPQRKRIALVAHDNQKSTLLAWARKHYNLLNQHQLFATGTTGHYLEKELKLDVGKLISGPLGGDQQIGAMITSQEIDLLVFFWDPFEPMPHDPDVKALLRVAAVWNIPVACNQSSADYLITSPLLQQTHDYAIPDYEAYMAARG